jgi:hypothetical protein
MTDRKNVVGFEVLTPVVMKNSIFWDITPCSLLKVNRLFGGIYRHHLQGRRISQARYNLLATWFHAGFLRRLFFDPEDDGNMFLRSVGWLSTACTVLYHRRHNSSETVRWRSCHSALYYLLGSSILLANCLAHFATLKTEAVCFSEMFVYFYRVRRCYTPEDITLLPNHFL